MFPLDVVKILNLIRNGKIPSEHVKFEKNSRNVMEHSFFRKTIIKVKGGEEIKVLKYHYADQNPNGSSESATMVKSGQWQPSEVGWLWTEINGRRHWLATINPKGAKNISIGEKSFVDNAGQWHINME